MTSQSTRFFWLPCTMPFPVQWHTKHSFLCHPYFIWNPVSLSPFLYLAFCIFNTLTPFLYLESCFFVTLLKSGILFLRHTSYIWNLVSSSPFLNLESCFFVTLPISGILFLCHPSISASRFFVTLPYQHLVSSSPFHISISFFVTLPISGISFFVTLLISASCFFVTLLYQHLVSSSPFLYLHLVSSSPFLYLASCFFVTLSTSARPHSPLWAHSQPPAAEAAPHQRQPDVTSCP